MARVRTQKAVAGRIDLNYHRRWHRWRVGRVLLVLGCTLAAGAWVAVASIGRDPRNPSRMMLVDRIHNPGAVTSAHAYFEHDCRACHDGTSPDGASSRYWLNVSDQACLKCHDGSLHHQNQKLATAHADVSLSDYALAVKDPGHPTGARSASCVACHVEHRGRDQLIGASNQLCVHCHAYIDRGMQSGQPRPNMRAVKFTVADHPGFGSRLAPGPGATGGDETGGDATGGDTDPRRWVDPTKLRFGHALHARPIRNAFLAAAGQPLLDSNQPAAYLATDCLACHENSASPMPVTDLSRLDPDRWSAAAPPPYLVPGAATAETPTRGDSRYMAPVQFDRHCFACHVNANDRFRSLTAPQLASDEDGFEDFGIEMFAIPHQDARVVRTYVESAVKASFARFESDRAGRIEAALASVRRELEQARSTPAGESAAPVEPAGDEAPAAPRGRGRGRGGSGESAEPAPPPEQEPPTAPRGRGRGRGAAEPETVAEAQPDAPAGGRGGRGGRGAPAAPPAPKTAADWIRAHTASAASGANSALSGIAGYADRQLVEPSEDTDLSVLVDYYTALVLARQCTACHDMTGQTPASTAEENRRFWNDGNAFATAPTGIPDAPRTWFAASTFDHFAHRGVDCVACHAPAWKSGTSQDVKTTATGDVLTCDIDGSYPGATHLGVAASTQSCVSCHHADTRQARGATDSCVSCHWYHDQKLARPAIGPLGGK